MKKTALLSLLLLATAGCAADRRPYAPVADPAYQAMGAEPFWMLTMGDDRIVLRQAGQPDRTWPRTLPRSVDGVRTWTSDAAGGSITVDARPGPCAAENERIYEDDVLIRVGGRELRGCGGRLARREQRREP
jgi:uncharacterized membrane protein